MPGVNAPIALDDAPRRLPRQPVATRWARTVYYGGSGILMERRDFDAQYVRQLTEGEASVERHFVSYFGELVRIKLCRRNWSRQDIEDIRQETFLRVFETLRHKGGLEHPERLGAFVNAVCNNVTQEFCRSHARHGSGANPAVNEPVDRAIDMEGALVAEERKKLVQKVLAGLAEADRDVLRMMFLEETTREQICQEKNIDRDYLRVLLYRARARFRQLAAMSGASGGSGSF